MAHLTARGAYARLVDRLNAFPQGAPPSDLLYRILELLFSEPEAALVAQLPIRPFTVERAARIWKVPAGKARLVLDNLADRAVLLDYESDGERRYTLPPPMAGFFEFSMMRLRGDVDQKAPRRALLPVPQRRGGLRPRAVHRRRDPTRPHLRARACATRRSSRSTSSTTSAPARSSDSAAPMGVGSVLLPSQDGARGARLRRPDGHLHDLRRHRRLADPPRLRTARGRQPRASICWPLHGNGGWSSSARTSARR